jgi:hypothetical protein
METQIERFSDTHPNSLSVQSGRFVRSGPIAQAGRICLLIDSTVMTLLAGPRNPGEWGSVISILQRGAISILLLQPMTDRITPQYGKSVNRGGSACHPTRRIAPARCALREA